MKLFGIDAIDTNIVVEKVYNKYLQGKYETIRYGNSIIGVSITLKNEVDISTIYKSSRFIEKLNAKLKSNVKLIDTEQRGNLYSVYLFIEGLN